jgi:hypothetical protein
LHHFIAFFFQIIWNERVFFVALHKQTIGLMTKKILIITMFTAILAYSPIAATASSAEMTELEQLDDDGISISVNQSTLHITGAQGQVLEVVSLTGRLITSIKIDSPSQRVELNIPKGCYILKIGKVVRKVSIR